MAYPRGMLDASRRSFLVRVASAVVLLSVVGCGGPTKRPDGGAGMLSEGTDVPALVAEAHDGTAIDLRAPKHRVTIVYFYPKDATPGCTKEACAFRDAWERFREADVGIVGVSADSLESHRAFAKEHALPFPLVADEQLVWAKAFGVPLIMGSLTGRVSFLIGADGKIVKVYPGVDPAVHADEVLADARAS